MDRLIAFIQRHITTQEMIREQAADAARASATISFIHASDRR